MPNSRNGGIMPILRRKQRDGRKYNDYELSMSNDRPKTLTQIRNSRGQVTMRLFPRFGKNNNQTRKNFPMNQNKDVSKKFNVDDSIRGNNDFGNQNNGGGDFGGNGKGYNGGDYNNNYFGPEDGFPI